MYIFIFLEILSVEVLKRLNITYFHFTSTVTIKTLEKYGCYLHGNVKEPFHAYSISHAINENYIINPLENYTSIKTKTIIQIKNQPAVTHTTNCLTSNNEILKSRAEYIVHHFVEEIQKRKSSMDQIVPKSMLVTSCRNNVLRYKDIIESMISELPKNDQFEVAVGFTPFSNGSTVLYEEDINEKGGNFLREFQNPKSKLSMLIVHSKYLLSFDEPLLNTM